MIDRFFLDTPLAAEQDALLDDAEFRHLKVMRISVGEEIELVNGEGILATARVVAIEKQKAHLHILSCTTKPRPTPLSLAIALIRPNRLEWVIEKATELGVHSLILYRADQSEKEGLSPNQQERLRHLTISALKQSGSLYLPRIELLPSLDIALQKNGRILFGDTAPDAPWLSTLNCKPTEPIFFFTGPEKGFSEREHQLLLEKGTGVKLNANILRAETAPIAALSILSCKEIV